jgi:hypothetical protein
LNDWPATKARHREGRCYELAYLAFLRLPADTEWSLIHGQVNGPGGGRIDHAWLQCPGWIWCPAAADAVAEVSYRLKYRAVEGVRYSRAEAAKMVVRDGHLGPWHHAGKSATGAGTVTKPEK